MVWPISPRCHQTYKGTRPLGPRPSARQKPEHIQDFGHLFLCSQNPAPSALQAMLLLTTHPRARIRLRHYRLHRQRPYYNFIGDPGHSFPWAPHTFPRTTARAPHSHVSFQKRVYQLPVDACLGFGRRAYSRAFSIRKIVPVGFSPVFKPRLTVTIPFRPLQTLAKNNFLANLMLYGQDR